MCNKLIGLGPYTITGTTDRFMFWIRQQFIMTVQTRSVPNCTRVRVRVRVTVWLKYKRSEDIQYYVNQLQVHNSISSFKISSVSVCDFKTHKLLTILYHRIKMCRLRLFQSTRKKVIVA